MTGESAFRGASRPKPWLASYPDIVPAEVPPLEHQSLPQLIEDCCQRFAARRAYSSMGRALTYRELDEETLALAAFFQALGLKKGDRVAVMLPNILQNPVAVFAILRAGLIVVNVNPLYTPRELEFQLVDSGARAIVILENFAATLERVLSATAIEHIVVTSIGEMLGAKGMMVDFVIRRVKKMVPRWSLPGHRRFGAAMEEGRRLRLRPVELAAGDVAFLQYTGGTTGTAKGAMLTHANLLFNKRQIELWLNSAFERKPRPEMLNMLCALPLYHIFALTVNSLMGISLGAHNLLVANPRDIKGLIKALTGARIHIFPGLNTLFNALLNNSSFARLDFSSLILSIGGGMAVQRPVAERWLQVTGSPVIEGYGLSETSPVVTANRFDSPDFTGSIGLPLPSTEIDIRDDEGRPVPGGEVGEVCIRGPQVMAGYWNRPEETAAAMTPDGFFKSGDMGFMDHGGYVRIVDRKKDMILVSGFNVYPNEVEEVAAMHPLILEAAAVGVPDIHSGEAVKLFVVPKDDSLTEEAVRTHCAGLLTNYKRPRYIEFRASLPKTPVGKILRKDLRG